MKLSKLFISVSLLGLLAPLTTPDVHADSAFTSDYVLQTNKAFEVAAKKKKGSKAAKKLRGQIKKLQAQAKAAEDRAKEAEDRAKEAEDQAKAAEDRARVAEDRARVAGSRPSGLPQEQRRALVADVISGFQSSVRPIHDRLVRIEGQLASLPTVSGGSTVPPPPPPGGSAPPPPPEEVIQRVNAYLGRLIPAGQTVNNMDAVIMNWARNQRFAHRTNVPAIKGEIDRLLVAQVGGGVEAPDAQTKLDLLRNMVISASSASGSGSAGSSGDVSTMDENQINAALVALEGVDRADIARVNWVGFANDKTSYAGSSVLEAKRAAHPYLESLPQALHRQLQLRGHRS